MNAVVMSGEIQRLLAMPAEKACDVLVHRDLDSARVQVSALAELARDITFACDPLYEAEIAAISRLLMKLDVPVLLTEKAHGIIECGFYFFKIGCSAQGIKMIEHVRELAISANDINLHRRCCNTISNLYSDIGYIALAVRRYDMALTLARQMKSDIFEQAALSNIAEFLNNLGWYREAKLVAIQCLQKPINCPIGAHLSFCFSIEALRSAHRLGDFKEGFEALQYFIQYRQAERADSVTRAHAELACAIFVASVRNAAFAFLQNGFEKFRAVCPKNKRTEIMLLSTDALYQWTYGNHKQRMYAKSALRDVCEIARASNLYYEEILRALVEVYSHHLTITEVEIGMSYAKQLIDYTVTSKREKFVQQMELAGLNAEATTDPLQTVKDWLHIDGAIGDAANNQLVGHKLANSTTSMDGESLKVAEVNVLQLMCRGMSNKEIAKELGLAPSTIKKRVATIFQHFGVNRRTEAVMHAMQSRLVA
jgi:DNA-binding CsgD family transcriptional regulator